MKNIIILFLILPFSGLSQVQTGNDIFGIDFLELFGTDVKLSADGSVVVVGAPGSDSNPDNGGNLDGQVRVFENINNSWVQVGQSINGEFPVGQIGSNLSISSDGSIIAVGNGQTNATGYIRVYKNVNNVWTQIGQDLVGTGPIDHFGISVDLSSDGAIVAVGANGTSRGYVGIYENISDTWVQIGQNIEGEFLGDSSGESISLSSDGSIIAIGARQNSGDGSSRGHVRIFQNINNTWTQIGQDINGINDFEQFGGRVVLSSDGLSVAISAISKYVRVFDYISGSWIQKGQEFISPDLFNDYGIGLDLSTDGSLLVIGEPNFDSLNGKATIYKMINNYWVELGNIIGDYNGQQHGYSVNLSSDDLILSIGTPRDIDNNSEITGSCRIFSLNEFIFSIPAFTEVIDDILGNTNNINITAEQLNSIYGVSGAIDGINYTTALDSGTFLDENSPTATEIQLIIDQVNAALSIQDNDILEFKFFPNPTKNQFTIEFNPSIELEEVVIYNTLGQVVLTSKEAIINTSKLASGPYIVNLITNKGVVSKQLIKE
jgi:hypothetical protein